jgi:hypothetical protein
MIDGSKFLFDHCLDQIAYAQYDDPDKSSTSASGEKVLVNWINKEKQTAEIVLYNFADNESQLPVKTLVTKASNVKFFKWAAGIIKNQEEQRLSQGACTIA